MSFNDKILERRFQLRKKYSTMWFLKLCYYIGTLIFLIYSIVTIATSHEKDMYTFSRFIVTAVFIVICIYINTKWFKKYYVISNLIIILSVIAYKIVSDYVRRGNQSDGSIVSAIFILIISTFFLFEIQYIILLDLIMIIPFYVRQYMNYHDFGDSQNFYVIFSNYILLTSLAVVSLYIGVQLEKQSRDEFLSSLNIDNQNSVYDNILSILVPDFV